MRVFNSPFFISSPQKRSPPFFDYVYIIAHNIVLVKRKIKKNTKKEKFSIKINLERVFLTLFFLLAKGGDTRVTKLTEKQKRFCTEYLIDCNATQAAIRAGYSKKTANEQGSRLLANVSIQTYIQEQMKQLESDTIASAEEIIKYLTSVLRGKTQAEIVVVEGEGDGCSAAKRVRKAPDEKERLKAAELLGKRYGLFKDNVNLDGGLSIKFVEDLEDDDG